MKTTWPEAAVWITAIVAFATYEIYKVKAIKDAALKKENLEDE